MLSAASQLLFAHKMGAPFVAVCRQILMRAWNLPTGCHGLGEEEKIPLILLVRWNTPCIKKLGLALDLLAQRAGSLHSVVRVQKPCVRVREDHAHNRDLPLSKQIKGKSEFFNTGCVPANHASGCAAESQSVSECFSGNFAGHGAFRDDGTWGRRKDSAYPFGSELAAYTL